MDATLARRGLLSFIVGPLIGGFRDTYLGRQDISRPGGPRAGMGQLEWASAVSSVSYTHLTLPTNREV